MAYLKSMGCLTPAGDSVEAVAQMLSRKGSFQRRPSPVAPPPLPDAGWIDPLTRPATWRGRPVRFGRLDRLSRVTLVSAQLALSGEDPPCDGARAGAALGSAFGSHQTNEQFRQSVERSQASPALFAYTLPSSAAGELSICLGLGGAVLTLTRGVGSGIAALAAAADLVGSGVVDWMLAGGCDVLGPTLLASAGAGAAELTEGGAFFTMSRDRAGAMARVAGWAQANGDGALARATDAALERAGVGREQVRTRSDCRGLMGLGAAGPVLQACLLLASGEPLPALVTAADASLGGVDVLCLDAP